MQDNATKLLTQYLDDTHLPLFAVRLTDWLIADLNPGDKPAPDFTESRAKALLKATNVIDDPTLHAFERLVINTASRRILLHQLLHETQLGQNNEIEALAATTGQAPIPTAPPQVTWLALITAAYAWKSEYALHLLDPASPPELYSPAGQLVKRTGHFIRRQVQYTATERDKLLRQLTFQPTTTASATTSAAAPSEPTEPTAPLPPHYRFPVPVRYPEVARETVRITPEETEANPLYVPPEEPEPAQPFVPEIEPQPPTVTRGTPLTITEADLPQPVRMPPIRVTEHDTKSTTEKLLDSANSFATSVRQKIIQERGPITTTRLRILVQEYPDGPGLYGVQVHITCTGIKSNVAGTTNRNGSILCELPIRVRGGLTYDVTVTWPRNMGHEAEKKSITLSAERTEFVLPFYRRLHQ